MQRRLEEVFGARIREVARARGVAISHVADRAGIAHSYFWQVLNADASPTLETIQRIADALEVEPLLLLRPAATAGPLPYASAGRKLAKVAEGTAKGRDPAPTRRPRPRRRSKSAKSRGGPVTR